MIVFAWWWCVVLWAAEGAVLDPALYLAPSPPMVPLSDGTSPGTLWTQQIRTERDAGDELAVLPIEILKTTKHSPFPTPTPAVTLPTAKLITTTTDKESMEGAETFWPRFRSTGRTGYAVGSVHIPLTFSLSGTYGGYGPSAGVVASRYASISDPTSLLGGYGKSALAGSSYAAYSGATRLYGGNGGAAWSGWGNGKWGHYGKG